MILYSLGFVSEQPNMNEWENLRVEHRVVASCGGTVHLSSISA
jgi:hypothetical protein